MVTSFNISNTDFRQFSPNPPTYSDSDNDVFIRLEGYILDRIQKISTITWHPAPEVEATPALPQYLSTVLVMCQLSNLKNQFHPDPYPNPSDRETAHFRIPVLDMFDSNIFTSHCGISQNFEDIRNGYEDVLGHLKNGERDKGISHPSVESVEDLFKENRIVACLSSRPTAKPCCWKMG
jgi:hypothetical protein